MKPLIGIVAALVATFALHAVPAGADLLPPAFGQLLLSVNWPSALPPLPSTTKPQPGAVPGCRHPSMGCVYSDIQRLETMRDRLGCDHRAIFPSTYLQVQLWLLRDLQRDRAMFGPFNWLATSVDTLFTDGYLDTFNAYAAGRPVAPAWKVAFDQAVRGETNGVQDIGLDVNAHVQNDQAFVYAQSGLREPGGASRKSAHDAFNLVMRQAFPDVLSQVALRYDPLASLASTTAPFGAIAGTETVMAWRELVWRNAERLLAAKTPAQYQSVAASIRSNALLWADALASLQVPGSRAQRDAYCHAQLDLLARRQLLTFRLGRRIRRRRLDVQATVAGPTPLPDLTFTVRNLFGRVVGRSRTTLVSASATVPVALLRHRLRRGSYTLTATATYTNGTPLSQVEPFTWR